MVVHYLEDAPTKVWQKGLLLFTPTVRHPVFLYVVKQKKLRAQVEK